MGKIQAHLISDIKLVTQIVVKWEIAIDFMWIFVRIERYLFMWKSLCIQFHQWLVDKIIRGITGN